MAGMLRWREMEDVVVEMDFRPEKEGRNKEDEVVEPWRGVAARDSMAWDSVREEEEAMALRCFFVCENGDWLAL